jgi:hypothetical protein
VSQLQRLALAFFCTLFAYAQYELVDPPLLRLSTTRSHLACLAFTPSSQPSFSPTDTGSLQYLLNISRMTQ